MPPARLSVLSNVLAVCNVSAQVADSVQPSELDGLRRFVRAQGRGHDQGDGDWTEVPRPRDVHSKQPQCTQEQGESRGDNPDPPIREPHS